MVLKLVPMMFSHPEGPVWYGEYGVVDVEGKWYVRRWVPDRSRPGRYKATGTRAMGPFDTRAAALRHVDALVRRQRIRGRGRYQRGLEQRYDLRRE